MVIITIAAIAIVVLLHDRTGQQEARWGWHVELWNLQEGYCSRFDFDKTMVLGRYAFLRYSAGETAVKEDITISREHLLLYEQNENLLAWNMSEVNVAVLNGQQLTAPRPLTRGSRLKLGDSLFLVTCAEKRHI